MLSVPLPLGCSEFTVLSKAPVYCFFTSFMIISHQPPPTQPALGAASPFSIVLLRWRQGKANSVFNNNPLSVHPSMYPSTCLSIHHSIYPSVFPSIYLSIYPSIHSSIIPILSIYYLTYVVVDCLFQWVYSTPEISHELQALFPYFQQDLIMFSALTFLVCLCSVGNVVYHSPEVL